MLSLLAVPSVARCLQNSSSAHDVPRLWRVPNNNIIVFVSLDALKNNIAIITGRTESIDTRISIEIPEDKYGLYASDVLDPDFVFELSFEQYVNTWIAITVPFQGAPGFIMDCLLTGVEFVKGWQGELFIAKWSMHQLLIECQAIYELMATKVFKWYEVPELRLWRQRQNNNGETEIEMEAFGPEDTSP